MFLITAQVGGLRPFSMTSPRRLTAPLKRSSGWLMQLRAMTSGEVHMSQHVSLRLVYKPARFGNVGRNCIVPCGEGGDEGRGHTAPRFPACAHQIEVEREVRR